MFNCSVCGERLNEDNDYGEMCEQCYDLQVQEWEKEQRELEKEYRRSVV